jgi:hypothetical protein
MKRRRHTRKQNIRKLTEGKKLLLTGVLSLVASPRMITMTELDASSNWRPRILDPSEGAQQCRVWHSWGVDDGRQYRRFPITPT